jgi:hypothetical protein
MPTSHPTVFHSGWYHTRPNQAERTYADRMEYQIRRHIFGILVLLAPFTATKIVTSFMVLLRYGGIIQKAACFSAASVCSLGSNVLLS